MKQFATELRLQCARRGSIAQICKATGINRQQFNKYLAGQILPNARTMRKICSYLQVTEEQLMSAQLGLFATGNAAATPANDLASGLANGFGRVPPALAVVRGATGAAAAEQLQPGVLPVGFYHCHMPVPWHPGVLVRWVVFLRPGERGQVFTTRTHLADARISSSQVQWPKFDGAVLYGARHACFVATARAPMHQSGVVSVDLQPIGPTVFSGLALVHQGRGTIAKTTALQYLGGDCSPRRALAGMGLIKNDDPGLDPVVARLLNAPPVGGTNWMQAISGKALQAECPPGEVRVSEAPMLHRLAV